MPKTATIGYDAWMKELAGQPPAGKFPSWTQEHIKFLKDARARGYSSAQIARALGKTVASVNNAVQRFVIQEVPHV